MESRDSPFQFSRSYFLVDVARNDGFAEGFRKCFDPGRQRFYGTFIHLRVLEQP